MLQYQVRTGNNREEKQYNLYTTALWLEIRRDKDITKKLSQNVRQIHKINTIRGHGLRIR